MPPPNDRLCQHFGSADLLTECRKSLLDFFNRSSFVLSYFIYFFSSVRMYTSFLAPGPKTLDEYGTNSCAYAIRIQSSWWQIEIYVDSMAIPLPVLSCSWCCARRAIRPYPGRGVPAMLQLSSLPLPPLMAAAAAAVLFLLRLRLGTTAGLSP